MRELEIVVDVVWCGCGVVCMVECASVLYTLPHALGDAYLLLCPYEL